MAHTAADYAQVYVEKLGLKLVPLPPKSKRPLTDDWGLNLLESPDQARDYFTQHPNANMGVALGPSRVCSFDVDDLEATRLIFDEFGWDFDAMLEQYPTIRGSDDGMRFLFRMPDDMALVYHSLTWPKQEGKGRKTIWEMRAADTEQRQDVLPPSIHPDTGRPYVWLRKPSASQGIPTPPEFMLRIWENWDALKPQLQSVCPWAPREQPRKQREPVQREGASVIDQFNAAHRIEDTLERYGYQRKGRRYLSPHSGTGLPGVNVFADDNKCAIHHASDPLCSDETGRPVGPFDLFCYYEHNGDASKAVKAAAEALGLPPIKREAPKPPAMQAPENVDPDTGEIIDQAANDNDPFRVMGYDHDKFFIFNNEKQQLVTWTVANMTEAGLLTLARLSWWMQYFPTQAKNDMGGFNKRSATDWLIEQCHRAGIYDPSRVRGRGAWIDDGRVVFHFGSHLWVDGQPMGVTQIKSRYVYEMDRELATPSDDALTDAEGRELVEIAEQFRWTKPASAALLSGFVALAPLCGALRWRPHVWITGGAGCGKTTVLNEYVHTLMGGMDVFAQGNSTEAGIRQTLRTDALPVLFDESEQNNEREMGRVQNVLSMIRQASTESAAKTLKGTAGGDAMHFIVRSMFCLSSIQVGMKHQADLERLTVLALRPKETDANAAKNWAALRDRLHRMNRDETLPARLFRRSLNMLKTTRANIAVFVEAATKKFGSAREGDQYGTLLAGCWSLMSSKVATSAEAAALIERYEWDEYRESMEVSESTKALGALLEAQLRAPAGAQLSAFEVISCAAGYPPAGVTMGVTDAEALLQRHGMRVQGESLLLSNNSQALADLLKHTPYAADWRGQLLRVEGVRRFDKAVRFGGVVSKCLAVPLAAIVDTTARREGPPF